MAIKPIAIGVNTDDSLSRISVDEDTGALVFEPNESESIRIGSTGLSESTDGNTYYPVVTQQDIGTEPNEIPLNQHLGSMAYQNLENLPIPSLDEATTPLSGSEELAVVQSGDTKKVSVSDLTAGKTVPVKYLVSTGNNNNITVANFENAKNGISFEDTDTGTAPGQLLGPLQWVSYDGSVIGNPRATAFISAVSENNFGNTSIGLFTGTQTQDPALALNVKSNKDVEIPTGNLVIGTAGKGIDFSADGQAAGMTSELLDDYEEGTWVATIGTPNNVTNASFSDGIYTKIGRLVTVTGLVTADIASTTAEIRFRLSLPFSIGTVNWREAGILYAFNGTGSDRVLIGTIGRAAASATQIFVLVPAQNINATGTTSFAFSFSFQIR